MDVVMGALPSLLPKMGELLVGEYKLQRGLRGEIMFLQTELASMQAALEKVSEVPTDQLDKQVQIWARDVRELSYNIEDSVDDFMASVDERCEPAKPHGFSHFIRRSLDLLTRAKVRHKIATDIKDIKRLLKEASELRDRYNVHGLLPSRPATTALDPRLLVRYKNVSDLVGTDEARDEIIQRLTEGGDEFKKQLQIVSIVGFGGLGKTTLANLVYQKLKVEFDCAAFVSVSQNPDVRKILKDLLYQLDKVRYRYICEATRDEPQLIEELREFLQNKRYFIVIDDIWDIKAWEVIKYALIENDYGNRIITTTRLLGVAHEVGGAYKLKPLPPDSSKVLFYGRIFGGEDQCPDHLAQVSKILLKKCGGVPLAIITIAGLLATKKGDIREWYKLCDSIGSGLDNSPDVKEMRRILGLSYYHLPIHLRTCLLYLSIFPEDYCIKREQLIWRWIAEGFLHGNQGENLYEVGESYFNELISRGMIQPVDIDIHDRATACRVHDMVLDLINSISSEENFATVLYDKKAASTAVTSKVRRLSLQLQDAEVAQGTMILSHVRSLTVSPRCVDKMPPLSSFPGLRVLDLNYCNLQRRSHCIKHIGSLCQLRYLGLRYTGIRQLPENVGNLQFLQMLDTVGACLHRLPSTVVQLRYLMVLKVSKDCTLPPDVIGKLESLQELSEIDLSISPHIAKELGRLTKLRVLKIEWKRSLDESLKGCLLESLRNLESIESLTVADRTSGLSYYKLWDFMGEGWAPPPRNLRSFRAQWGKFSYLPSWINPSNLQDLSVLEIGMLRLRQEDLDILGRLPALQSLKLLYDENVCDSETRQWPVVRAGAFQCLRECQLWLIPKGGNMFARGAMPRVQSVSFFCDVELVFNLGLENLPSLQKLKVDLTRSPDCYSPWKVDEAVAELRCVADNHPNRPTLELETGRCYDCPDYLDY